MNPIFPSYPLGSNISIINTIYYPPVKINNKYQDAIDIIAYDLDKKKLIATHITDPDYEFFIAKKDSDLDLSYNHLFADGKQLEKVTCKYKERNKFIAELIGRKDEFYENIRNHNREANEKMMMDTRLFGSDVDIEDFYRGEFARQYKNELFEPPLGFMDIEVDILGLNRFVQPGERPVNAVSFYNFQTGQVDVFLLRTEGNLQDVLDFEDKVKNDYGGLRAEVKRWMMKACDGKYEDIIDTMMPVFHFYDMKDEISMIKDLFYTMNHSGVAYVIGWNFSFDMTYLIERVKALGFDSADVLCDERFPWKICQYIIDDKNKATGITISFGKRKDHANITSMVVYTDGMINYCRRRLQATESKKVNLDTIAESEAGVHKLDYSWTGADISTLAYKNYPIFVIYNIGDVFANAMVEYATHDVDYYLASALANDTRYQYIERPTVDLVNRYRKEWREEGYIMGNNYNAHNQVKIPYPGAFISSEVNNSDFSRMKFNNKLFSGKTLTSEKFKELCKSYGIKNYNKTLSIYNNTNDYDATAMYPSSAANSNISPNTLIGFIDIHGKKKSPTYTLGSMFCEDMSSGDYISICHRWFNMPDFMDLCKSIEDAYYDNGIAYSGSIMKATTFEINVSPEDKYVVPFALNYNTKQFKSVIPFRIMPNNISEDITRRLSDVYQYGSVSPSKK